MSPLNKLSTFEKMMQNSDFKAKFESGYQEFLISELLNAVKENDHVSIAQLVKEINISPSIMQNICLRKQQDLKISDFLEIAQACGCGIVIEKENERVSLV